MDRSRGLTLTELAISATIVAVVASVAVPAAVSRRIDANETSAVSALVQIQSAQAMFQAAKFVDVDNDGVGEYGLMRELSGWIQVRTNSEGTMVGSPASPFLRPEFRGMPRRSEIARAGYLFQIVLPTLDGVGVPGPPYGWGALVVALNSDLCETTWGCYAWPEKYGRTGIRTFFTNQTDDIVATESRAYSGGGAIHWFGGWPTYSDANTGAAFVAGGSPSNITGQLAIGTVGRDGNVWRLVTPRAEESVSGGRTRTQSWRGDGRSIDVTEVRAGVHARLTATDDGFAVRASQLPANMLFRVVLSEPGSVDVVPFGVVLSDRRGRARFKFDSRTHRYPSGFSSLLPFSGGWIDLRDVGGAGWGYAQRFPYLEAEASRGPFEDAVDANEANAIAALRQIAAAQDAFLAAKACDVDQDGVAEYGLLREMSGTIRVRTAADASTAGPLVQPSLLPAAFGASNDDSDLPRSGYLFHVMLPGAAGIGVPERSQGALAQALNIDLSETTWCCYAWPEKYEKTGRRAFFINQSGDILSTETIWYSGTGAFTATNTGAAFRAGGSVTNITGQVATGTRGRDGNLWRPVPSRPADHEFSVSSVLTPVEPDSGVSGTFTLRSVETRNDDRGIAELEVCGGARNANWRFVVTNGGFYDRVRDGSCLRLGNRFVYDVRPFAGGTVEIRDGDTPVLRGTLPALTTVLGASVPGSTASFRATGWLDAAPRQLPKRGAFDLRVTNSEAGMRRELTVVLTTHDRLAGPATVTFFDAVGAPTPLGTITPRGRKGEGTLRIDSDTGEAPPATGPGGLSGGRIEIRDEFGTLLVSGALPVVE